MMYDISRQGMRKKYTYIFEQKNMHQLFNFESYWFMSYIGSRSIYINNMLMQLKYDDGPGKHLGQMIYFIEGRFPSIK